MTADYQDELTPLQLGDFRSYLAPRARDAYKGDFGHVLVIGGNLGMAGAVRMAAEAAARVGAGLVSVATQIKHLAIVSAMRPEIMCHGVKRSKELVALLERATVVVLGPGLGQNRWSKKLFAETLSIDLPMIVDADGLNLLAQQPQKRDNWILTPHLGEAARLLETDVVAIKQDRLHAARAVQEKFGGVCVLKGAGTLVVSSPNDVSVCLAGNPGMATGGMGDILSGMIGGLLAQRIPLTLAAKVGVLVHALAADRVAAQDGERGLLALDLLPEVRRILNFKSE